mmetsp:Transcript_69738/g.151736  ORF Transcript_69738/g.151736 Transcript_69738/m.151736 type:complete len:220 (-) Transcript_69738:504-1163(-)
MMLLLATLITLITLISGRPAVALIVVVVVWGTGTQNDWKVHFAVAQVQGILGRRQQGVALTLPALASSPEAAAPRAFLRAATLLNLHVTSLPEVLLQLFFSFNLLRLSLVRQSQILLEPAPEPALFQSSVTVFRILDQGLARLVLGKTGGWLLHSAPRRHLAAASAAAGCRWAERALRKALRRQCWCCRRPRCPPTFSLPLRFALLGEESPTRYPRRRC